MEQERCEEYPQSCDAKSKTIPCDLKTESASSHGPIQEKVLHESKGSVDVSASPTPTKTVQPLRTKKKQTGLSIRGVGLFPKENEDGAVEDESVEGPDGISGYNEAKVTNTMSEAAKAEIPDIYKPLSELFDGLDTSIRLLSLRKKLPTFQNICFVVKALTQRILSCGDLAQIKYLLPESICIEKILIQDAKTLCMMPDMKITFLLDVIEPKPNQSTFMALREIFHQRLLDFYNQHTESSDIPEAMLPEPFSQRNQSVLPGPLAEISLIESSHADSEPLSLSSSFGQSIRKHFSQKIIVPETEKTELLASSVSPISVNLDDETSSVSDSATITLPDALISNPENSSSSASDSPPKKLAPVYHHTVTVETPVQPTPAKRLAELSSCEKKDNDNRVIGLTAAKRSLIFDDSLETTITKNIDADYKMVQETNSHKMDPTDIMNIVQSIFKSVTCGSLITKQELLQKIIANNLDIVDIREAEEQLELLEKVAPDWIFQKLLPSGDVLYSVRKVSDLELIRSKLTRAV